MLDGVYIKLPPIYEDDTDMVNSLLRALYDHPIRTSGNLWNTDFVKFRVRGFPTMLSGYVLIFSTYTLLFACALCG